MAYRKSAARNEFESKIQRLKSTVRQASRKKQQLPVDIRNLAYHAAVFETSAGMEEYVKSLFDGFAYRIRQKGATTDHIPSALRTFIFVSRVKTKFESYLYSGDEKTMLAALDVNSSAYDVIRPGSILDKTARIEAVCVERKYPSPKNWQRLYQRVGMPDVFGLVSSALSRDAESLLESFNDVRTAIAHENPPDLTITDVVRHLDNMIDFVRALDRVTFQYMNKYAIGRCWPS